jgi:hypothetical protein
LAIGNWQSEVFLLNLSVAGRANAKLLTVIQVNVSAPLAEDTCRADAGANSSAHCRPGSTPGNRTDDCANTRGRADFLNVAFG